MKLGYLALHRPKNHGKNCTWGRSPPTHQSTLAMRRAAVRRIAPVKLMVAVSPPLEKSGCGRAQTDVGRGGPTQTEKGLIAKKAQRPAQEPPLRNDHGAGLVGGPLADGRAANAH